MKYLYFLILTACFFSCNDDSDSTTTPNLTSNIEVYDEALIENSLVMAVQNGSNTSYLLNKEGEKLYEWNFDTRLGNDLELLPNGKLLGMFKVNAPEINFGGAGGTIKILNPNSAVEWQYTYETNDYISHHDVEMLPNGNILFLVWERVSESTAQLNGVNIEGTDIFPEALIEIDPTTNQIAWEWHSFDHIIQGFDSNLLNYGTINNNPNLIDINYNITNNGDFMHANGIDYDETKDVIYISINGYSEIWTIDHSTTITEAASNIGGDYNKGGDLIYRFGNPEAYNNLGNRLFYNNHFPNLIEEDVPGKDNMLVFVNKDNNIEQSAVYELNLPENFNLLANTNNEPEIVWSYTNPDMYSRIISGAVRLRNGNTLICEGDYGFWEITPNGTIAWKYNGDGNSFWRCYNYKIEDTALNNLELFN